MGQIEWDDIALDDEKDLPSSPSVGGHLEIASVSKNRRVELMRIGRRRIGDREEIAFIGEERATMRIVKRYWTIRGKRESRWRIEIEAPAENEGWAARGPSAGDAVLIIEDPRGVEWYERPIFRAGTQDHAVEERLAKIAADAPSDATVAELFRIADEAPGAVWGTDKKRISVGFSEPTSPIGWTDDRSWKSGGFILGIVDGTLLDTFIDELMADPRLSRNADRLAKGAFMPLVGQSASPAVQSEMQYLLGLSVIQALAGPKDEKEKSKFMKDADGTTGPVWKLALQIMNDHVRRLSKQSRGDHRDVGRLLRRGVKNAVPAACASVKRAEASTKFTDAVAAIGGSAAAMSAVERAEVADEIAVTLEEKSARERLSKILIDYPEIVRDLMNRK